MFADNHDLPLAQRQGAAAPDVRECFFASSGRLARCEDMNFYECSVEPAKLRV